MKPNKITTLLLAATTCGVVWASVGSFTNSIRKHNDNGEKVRPTQGLTELARISHANYTPLKAEGNNGVPYGLKLDGVNNRTVNLSWISPEPIDGYFEDFEGHNDFEVNSAGSIGWSYIDADNNNTYTRPSVGVRKARPRHCLPSSSWYSERQVPCETEPQNPPMASPSRLHLSFHQSAHPPKPIQLRRSLPPTRWQNIYIVS